MKVSGLISSAESSHWWYQSRRDIISHVFWKNEKNNTDQKILSVGCGSGIELVYLSKFGNVSGIDLSDQCIENCRDKGFTAFKEDITKCSLPSNSYDVIFCMDVLEHIADHKKAYSEIIRMLKKGGKCIITVPACKFLWSDFDEIGEFPHFRRYSKKNLRELLITEQVGVLKLSYYNSFLLPAVFAARKLNVGTSAQLQTPGKFVNNTLRAIFSSEKYILNRLNFPIGCSLVAVCQKK